MRHFSVENRHFVRSGWTASAVAFAGAVTLIVIQLTSGTSSPDGTTLGLFLLAAAFGFGAFAPRSTARVIARVSTIHVGNVELGLSAIKQVERIRPPIESDGVRPKRPTSADYPGCVALLKKRLRQISDMLAFDPNSSDPAGIAGELRSRGLLTQDEENFILRLLRGADPVSDEWSRATESEFLDGTWAFISRLRSLIADRRLRQQLESGGWFLVEFAQPEGHRRDFLAYKDGAWILLASRIGSSSQKKTPEVLDGVADRLRGVIAGPELRNRLIVLPDGRSATLSDPNHGQPPVSLVHLSDLTEGYRPSEPG